MHNQNSHHQPLPQYDGSSQRFTEWLKPFVKFAVFLFLFILMEITLGHPALRYEWIGDPAYAAECTMVTIGFEKHTLYGQVPLFTFVEPDNKLSDLLWHLAVDAKDWLVNKL